MMRRNNLNTLFAILCVIFMLLTGILWLENVSIKWETLAVAVFMFVLLIVSSNRNW